MRCAERATRCYVNFWNEAFLPFSGFSFACIFINHKNKKVRGSTRAEERHLPHGVSPLEGNHPSSPAVLGSHFLPCSVVVAVCSAVSQPLSQGVFLDLFRRVTQGFLPLANPPRLNPHLTPKP